MNKPIPHLRAFRKLAAELHEASAAFRVDAIHNRLTGVDVVLEGTAPDGLADLLHEAAFALDALLTAVGAPPSSNTEGV